jgi:hypothetical protein
MKWSVLNQYIQTLIAATGAKTDAAATGAVGTTTSQLAYIKQLVNVNLAVERCVEQPVCALTNAAQPLFNITGGPILMVAMYAIVSVDTGATATNGTLQELVTAPSATVVLGTTVSVASKATGTSIRWINTTGILTPVTAGIVPIYPATIATLDISALLPVGQVQFLTTAANTGNIKFYMVYKPLSPSCVVVAV